MTPDQKIEQLRTSLRGNAEAQRDLLAGRVPAALSLEELKQSLKLEEREAELHHEIDAIQREMRKESMSQKTPTPRETRAAERKNILNGRAPSECTPRELFALSAIDDADELESLHASGAIRPGMSAADIAEVRNRSARRDDAR